MRAGADLGLASQPGEIVARIGLEGQHRRRQAAVRRLRDEQREHRLVAAMDAVEIADRQRAVGGEAGVPQAAEDAHGARLWAAGLRRQGFLRAAPDSLRALGRRSVAPALLIGAAAEVLDRGAQVALAVRRVRELAGRPAVGGRFVRRLQRDVAELVHGVEVLGAGILLARTRRTTVWQRYTVGGSRRETATSPAVWVQSWTTRTAASGPLGTHCAWAGAFARATTKDAATAAMWRRFSMVRRLLRWMRRDQAWHTSRPATAPAPSARKSWAICADTLIVKDRPCCSRSSAASRPAWSSTASSSGCIARPSRSPSASRCATSRRNTRAATTR